MFGTTMGMTAHGRAPDEDVERLWATGFPRIPMKGALSWEPLDLPQLTGQSSLGYFSTAPCLSMAFHVN